MAKRRYVDTSFWDDNYIINLDPIEKLLFLYFLTNPLTKISGIYEISLRRIAFDTGIDKDMILKVIDRFSKINKIYYIDSWIYIRNFQKHQNIKNSKIKKGIESEIQLIPTEIIKKIGVIDKSYMTHIGLINNSDSDSDSDSDILSKDNTKSKDFEIKTRDDINILIEEIKLLCDELGVAYNKDKDRMFGKHIIEGIDFGNFCNNIGQTRIEFAKNILKASVKINYWKGVCSGPKLIYQNYSDVYNQTKLKNKKTKEQSKIAFIPGLGE